MGKNTSSLLLPSARRKEKREDFHGGMNRSCIVEPATRLANQSLRSILLKAPTPSTIGRCGTLINGMQWIMAETMISVKHFEAHTDFIYAIAGEEWGLPATLGVLLAFGCILVCGLLIATRAPDRLGRLMAFGLTLLLPQLAKANADTVEELNAGIERQGRA